MRLWFLNHKEIDNERINCFLELHQLKMDIDEVTVA